MSRCIFFDLDGTLVNTRRDLVETVNHTRRDLGLVPLPVEDVAGNIGLGARHLLEASIPECLGARATRPTGFEELLATFRRHYAEHMLETCQPYPGVVEALEIFRARGWKMGVNTAKPSFATHAILERFDLVRFFGEAVVAGGDCAEMKPSAAPLRLCAARMGVTQVGPDDWMVGDNWTDMACAENAGVSGAFCAYGFGFLRDARYALKIERMRDLPDRIGLASFPASKADSVTVCRSTRGGNGD